MREAYGTASILEGTSMAHEAYEYFHADPRSHTGESNPTAEAEEQSHRRYASSAANPEAVNFLNDKNDSDDDEDALSWNGVYPMAI